MKNEKGGKKNKQGKAQLKGASKAYLNEKAAKDLLGEPDDYDSGSDYESKPREEEGEYDFMW